MNKCICIKEYNPNWDYDSGYTEGSFYNYDSPILGYNFVRLDSDFGFPFFIDVVPKNCNKFTDYFKTIIEYREDKLNELGINEN